MPGVVQKKKNTTGWFCDRLKPRGARRITGAGLGVTHTLDWQERGTSRAQITHGYQPRRVRPPAGKARGPARMATLWKIIFALGEKDGPTENRQRQPAAGKSCQDRKESLLSLVSPVTVVHSWHGCARGAPVARLSCTLVSLDSRSRRG